MSEEASKPTPGGLGSDVPPIPAGSILMHIGVHKTGTTNLQDRLTANRKSLAERGIRYPGKGKEHHLQAGSLVGAKYSWEAKRTPEEGLRIWDAFAQRMHKNTETIVLSSELFCQAKAEQVRYVVDGLGADRVHVLVAFRPLSEILPSTWQQYLKAGRTGGYEQWLRQMLAERDPGKPAPSFWRRNDVPDLLQRWSKVIGPERITAVVLDGTDFDVVPRTTAALLGLPLDTLSVDPSLTRHNRSMSAAESEFARQLNIRARETMSGAQYVFWVRAGALRGMVEGRRAGPDEPGLGLPDWTVPRLTALGEQHAEALRSSGVRVVGDPDVLARPPVPRPVSVPTEVPIDAAVEAMVGAINRSKSSEDDQDSDSLSGFRSTELMRVVAGRAGHRARRVLHLPQGERTSGSDGPD